MVSSFPGVNSLLLDLQKLTRLLSPSPLISSNKARLEHLISEGVQSPGRVRYTAPGSLYSEEVPCTGV